MTSAIAAFARWFKGDTQYAVMQNFFVDQTVDGHEYRSFNTSEIEITRSGDSAGIVLVFPATKANLLLGDAALNGLYLVEVKLYEMPVDHVAAINFADAVEVASFIGEVQTMYTNLQEISVEIGSALDAISGDIPGRKITTSLVGRLPTL